MSTDRELLELAAKAIGYQTGHKWNRERLEMNPPVMAMVVHDATGELVSTGWNPLTDDGDALRLAATLTMNLYMGFGGGVAAAIVSDGDDGSIYCKEDGADFMAATRRAIVRAAAEIGRAMS